VLGKHDWHKTSSTRTVQSAATTKVAERCPCVALIAQTVYTIGTGRASRPRHYESCTTSSGHRQRTLRSRLQRPVRYISPTDSCDTELASVVSLDTFCVCNQTPTFRAALNCNAMDTATIAPPYVVDSYSCFYFRENYYLVTTTNIPRRNTLLLLPVLAGLKRSCCNMVLLVAA
jgi:hypothetical protein